MKLIEFRNIIKGFIFLFISLCKRDREIIKFLRRINIGMKCEEILIMVCVFRNLINKIFVYELKC